MNILLTGGTGFIGSHTAVLLLEAGHQVILYDNLSNSSDACLQQIQKITQRTPIFIKGDILDQKLLENTLRHHNVRAVIHFAGLKAVGESTQKPIRYYTNNVSGTLTLLQAMQNVGVHTLIFSSSSTVYGNPHSLPLTEDAPTQDATNPYGQSKLFIEKILRDCVRANPQLSVICLRYFNPIGAHPSGLIGENPNGIPNNLLPYVAQVAHGRLPKLKVYGNDYPTPDGTGMRDFIHVMDLAAGHVKAVQYASQHNGWDAINLGCGRAYSVLEVIHTFREISGHPIPYEIVARRPGDIAANWCDPSKANKLLHWKTQYSLKDMCRDAWNFELTQQTKH